MKKIGYDNIRRVIAGLLLLTLVFSTLLVLQLKNKNSVAYLYDEQAVQADYSVAQLSFDLKSNHMYSFYSENPGYTGAETELVLFRTVLDSLNTLFFDFDSGRITAEAFDTGVKTALSSYYGNDMINELQGAWNDNNTDQFSYDEAVRTIYNKYYTLNEFLFRMKTLQIELMDVGKSIWYYYSQDLLETYFKEYVVQTDATGVRQSTVRIGAKLKGGTTYTADSTSQYYDPLFNDMVTAYTMQFTNSGNVYLYLNNNFIDFVRAEDNDGKGVLGLLLPYGQTWENLLGGSYDDCYDAVAQKWNYRLLIASLLASRAANYVSSYNSTLVDNPFGSLDYTSTEALLKEWNAYAISTYTALSGDNTNGNIIVYPPDVGDTYMKSISMSMLFWADYEKCAEYYSTLNTGMSWRDDDPYELIRYIYNINIKTSLKNDDMSSYTASDWEQLFAKQKDYSKFAGVSNFDVEGYAYFEQVSGDSVTVTNAKNYMDGGYIICNYTDPTAVNYIMNLRFKVFYRGFSPAYIRVRFVEQFTNARGEIEAVNQMKFNLDPLWSDNRADDLYFYSEKQYFSADSAAVTTSGRPRLLSIPVINGLASNVLSPADIDPLLARNTSMTLKVSFLVEAVQPNRTETYWNRTVQDIIDICAD